jgi:ribosomal protein S18 acetylase RimI-like enzyme
MAVLIRRAGNSDLPAIAEIYRVSFPEMIKPRLGKRVCMRFFNEFLNHDAYRLIVASFEGDLLGFSLIHTDLSRSIDNRSWIRGSWFDLILFFFHNPLFSIKKMARLPAAVMKKRKAAPAQKPAAAGKRSGYIAPIAVARSARGRGVGKKLLGASIAIAREESVDLLKLNVDRQNAGAIRIYEFMGFRKTGMIEERNEFSYTFDCRQPTPQLPD